MRGAVFPGEFDSARCDRRATEVGSSLTYLHICTLALARLQTCTNPLLEMQFETISQTRWKDRAIRLRVQVLAEARTRFDARVADPSGVQGRSLPAELQATVYELVLAAWDRPSGVVGIRVWWGLVVKGGVLGSALGIRLRMPRSP